MKSSKLSLKNKIHGIIAIPFLLLYISLVFVNAVFLAMGLVFMYIHQRITHLLGLLHSWRVARGFRFYITKRFDVEERTWDSDEENC